MRSTYTPPLLADPAFLVSAGLVGGASTVNKFGRAPDGTQTTATDIWDRADATPTQQVWTAPTQARTHTIASTDADDTDGGAGARTVEVFGLTAWNADETSETVTMNTASPPTTVSSYVIIHRMIVRTAGGSATNEGIITAQATTDGTYTAQINAAQGQTQMAIYGVPSTKVAYVAKYYGSVNRAQGAPASINLSLLVAEDANTDVDFFVVKHTLGMQSTGASSIEHAFNPYFKVPGPAIIKMQGIASAADVESSAGFDIILVDA
jgi:hypothetical protein